MFHKTDSPHPLVGTLWRDDGMDDSLFLVKTSPDFSGDVLVTFMAGRYKGIEEYYDVRDLLVHCEFVRGSWRKNP